MIAINTNMENMKSVAPIATLPHSLKDCKMRPTVFGRSKIPCARSDNTPAMTRRDFVNESRDIIFKRIAQKRNFFYQPGIHDQRLYFKLLSTLKVFKRISDIIFCAEGTTPRGSDPYLLFQEELI
jgi:hypothetical protein